MAQTESDDRDDDTEECPCGTRYNTDYEPFCPGCGQTINDAERERDRDED